MLELSQSVQIDRSRVELGWRYADRLLDRQTPTARRVLSTTMTRKSQSDPWERWIVSRCGLNKRLERSFTVGLLGILSELTDVPVLRRRVPTRSLAPCPLRESLADAVAWLRQTGPIAASGDGTERTMLPIGLAPDDVRVRSAPDGRRESEVK